MREANGATRRLFVAVSLPADVKDLAGRMQNAISQERSMRLVRLDQLHCTLAFIGAVDESRVHAARKVVSRISRETGGHTYTGEMLLLPNGRQPRVIALGLDDRDGTLARLHARVVSGLEAEGLAKKDERAYRAHVTLARVKGPGPMQPMAECECIRFGVESVSLYESELRREGPVYSVLERIDLQRAQGQEKA